ncbi:hypothetical protein KIW84_062351 [Lathyrus oleraceus]|uniref:Retrotransposon gag domain-containing protein n=1 Tax=Pisum sativum TaxID=3888 RepID=A0A9D4W6N8_PEA|nr:hypothetical protein KIW84_062351 [Pisum sativum]
MPQPSVARKKIVDQLVLEKTQMKAFLRPRFDAFGGSTHLQLGLLTLFLGILRMTSLLFSCIFHLVSEIVLSNHGTFGAREQRTEGRDRPTDCHDVVGTSCSESIFSNACNSSSKDSYFRGGYLYHACCCRSLRVCMSAGFPWGMPPYFMTEGFAPTFASMPASSPVMSVPPPVVHTLPHVEDTIYHSEPSEGPDVYEKMDERKDQFLDLRKELKTLRGKELFGKSVVELCLVPNVKILVKFKVPDFEKYEGNTCPLSHLVMYARKMSTQTNNDKLLIHYFQDSLTGVMLRWYMGLNSASIHTFNDLGEDFVKQYKYNVDMAPDRDQLRSMS